MYQFILSLFNFLFFLWVIGLLYFIIFSYIDFKFYSNLKYFSDYLENDYKKTDKDIKLFIKKYIYKNYKI